MPYYDTAASPKSLNYNRKIQKKLQSLHSITSHSVQKINKKYKEVVSSILGTARQNVWINPRRA